MEQRDQRGSFQLSLLTSDEVAVHQIRYEVAPLRQSSANLEFPVNYFLIRLTLSPTKVEAVAANVNWKKNLERS